MTRVLRAAPLTALTSLLITGMSTAQSPVSEGPLLTDFDGGGLPLRWYTQHDTVMGGRSSGSFEVADGRVRFTGKLNTNGGGFASIRTRDIEMGLEGQEGIYLRVRGDGREYSLRLQQSGERGRRASYRATFRTEDLVNSDADRWQDVYLPFADFVPTWRGRTLDRPAIDPSRINMCGVTLADKVDGPFVIEVDRLAGYGPSAQKGVEESRVRLVLSARDAADLSLIRQRRDLQADAEGVAQRKLEVVVLFADSGSRGGERLDREAVSAIRDELGLSTRGFAAMLLDASGEVVLRRRSAIELDDLYRRIDQLR